MKKTDLAYIAGLFDGEGCISFTRPRIHPKKGCWQGVYICASLGNTEEYVVRWLQMAFGGSVSKRPAGRKPYPNSKAFYQWGISGEQAAEFLKVIFPYLRIKMGQADIAIKYREYQKGRYYGPSHKKSEEEKAIEEAYSIMMKAAKE